MPHNFQGGFYTTSDVPPTKPTTALDTKTKQTYGHGGEYQTNTKTETNDREKT